MKNYIVKIAAGIVVFNPDSEERLKKNIDSVLKQVDKVYVFDNSTKQYKYKFPDTVEYMTLNQNKGIAYGMNRIMEAAQKDGFDWVVTMDQDSILPEGIIKGYTREIIQNGNIAIVCPQVIDVRRAYMEINKELKKEYVDFCITSASCTSIKAWKDVGKFDEWLFIDLVDNDFCKRLTIAGYKILRLNEFVLNQEFGRIIPKSVKKQKFWIGLSKIFHNQNIAKFSYYKFVSPMRVYYTNRNIIYVNRKLKQYGSVGYRENYNCKGYFGFLLCFCVPSLLRAQDKRAVLKAILNGIRDGRKKKVKQWMY